MFSKPKDPSDPETGTEYVAEPRAIYEIDDFAALDASQVAELLQRAEADLANNLVGCAHLVVTCDLSTGLVNHHIPSSNGYEALALASKVLADKRAEDPEQTFTIKVTPLLPH